MMTVYRNIGGIVAITEDGTLIYGSDKFRRAVDVTSQITTNTLIPIADNDLSGKRIDLDRLIRETGALGIERSGTDIVFFFQSATTKPELLAFMAAHIPTRTEIEKDREVLRNWNLSGAPVARAIIEKIVSVLDG